MVFVAGLEQGLVPIGRAESPEAEAEERRLLYVAVTRAQQELHCTWASRRTFGTKTVRRQPSPWLDLIEEARARLEGRPPVSQPGRRSGLAAARAKLPKGAKRGDRSAGARRTQGVANLGGQGSQRARVRDLP